MRLPDHRIRQLALEGMISPYRESQLNPASYDVTLGSIILLEENVGFREIDISDATYDNPYWLAPGEFCLAETQEIFSLPDNVAAQFVLKSSRAREGYENLYAGYCDPGWSGSRLTLELKNALVWSDLALWPGMKIGQMVFDAMLEACERSYRVTGRYNNDERVTPSKG
ncbi:MAG: dCTP deaminase [Limnohabitans sp.]